MEKINFKTICWWLVIFGAINWGLIGAFNFNLLMFLIGKLTTVIKVIYVLIGFAGIYLAIKR